MVDSVVPEALVEQQWMSYSPVDDKVELVAGEMTEKERELLKRWLQLAPPKKKLRQLKLKENQLTLFEM